MPLIAPRSRRRASHGRTIGGQAVTSKGSTFIPSGQITDQDGAFYFQGGTIPDDGGTGDGFFAVTDPIYVAGYDYFTIECDWNAGSNLTFFVDIRDPDTGAFLGSANLGFFAGGAARRMVWGAGTGILPNEPWIMMALAAGTDPFGPAAVRVFLNVWVGVR